MLGLILIYFIGKKFYDLAIKHGKSKWGFGIAGVACYYAGTIIAGILLAVGIELWGSVSIDEINDLTINFISLPFGILACVGLYKGLERKWSRNQIQLNPNILDDGLTDL